MNEIHVRHLFWIPAGAAMGFLASFIFGDLIMLPVDLYYLIYLVIVMTFLIFYWRTTNLELKKYLARHLSIGAALGLGFGALMLFNVLSRPSTPRFTGALLYWEIFWRGIVYGVVDGLLLYSFPWIVTWRAFKADLHGVRRKILVSVIAWIFIVLMTTIYHLGYSDFRSPKIIQPNIGSTIMSVPTLVSTNPVASPVSHVIMHITAVVHSPQTDLFLPPHRTPTGNDQDIE